MNWDALGALGEIVGAAGVRAYLEVTVERNADLPPSITETMPFFASRENQAG